MYIYVLYDIYVYPEQLEESMQFELQFSFLGDGNMTT